MTDCSSDKPSTQQHCIMGHNIEGGGEKKEKEKEEQSQKISGKQQLLQQTFYKPDVPTKHRQSYRHADPRRQRPQVAQRGLPVMVTIATVRPWRFS